MKTYDDIETPYQCVACAYRLYNFVHTKWADELLLRAVNDQIVVKISTEKARRVQWQIIQK